jgi:hypothetical protein
MAQSILLCIGPRTDHETNRQCTGRSNGRMIPPIARVLFILLIMLRLFSHSSTAQHTPGLLASDRDMLVIKPRRMTASDIEQSGHGILGDLDQVGMARTYSLRRGG